jgi:membrane fusion protein (multidrug efflux system)
VKKPKRHPYPRALVVLLAAGLVAACSPDAGAPAAAAGGKGGGNAQSQPVAVVSEATKREPLAVDIEAVGTAQARESVDLTAKVANTITAIGFREGERVERGTVLVQFDRAQTEADLAGAEAALAESRAQYGRSLSLVATRVLSQSQLDQIKATLEVNEARVAAAKARHDDTVIRAPFGGRAGFRRVSIGSFVSPGTLITTLDDISLIKVEFAVPQTFQFALREGLGVNAEAAGLPGRKFAGKVTAIDSRVDATTRSIRVRAEIPNKDGVLKPGTFMTVRLSVSATPALLVPEAALVPEQGSVFVFVVDGGVVQKRLVTIGRRTPGHVEIASGLADGERVVVEGTQKIRDKSPVRESDLPAVASG